MDSRFIIVVLMIVYSIVSYFDRTIISIAGHDIMLEFHLSETQMGAIYSAFLFGYALAMIPGGYVADRLGPSRTLTAMGFGAALFTMLTGISARPGLGALLGIVPGFIFIRLLLGISTAPLYPACGRMIADRFPPTRRGVTWGLIAAGAGLGSALTPTLFVWLLSLYSWRKSFSLAGAATGALAVAWWSCVGREASGKISRSTDGSTYSTRGWRYLLEQRNVLLLAMGYFTVGYFEYIFFYWIYFYFKEVRHLSQSQVSIDTTLVFLAWVVMTPAGGFASDYLTRKLGNPGRQIVPIIAIFASVLLFILGIKTSNSVWIGVLFSLSFGFVSSTGGPFWSTMIASARENAGAACGILNTGSTIGAFIAPVLTPFLASTFGWSWALYFGCVILLLGVVIWFCLDIDIISVN